MNPTLPTKRFPSIQTRHVKLIYRHRWVNVIVNYKPRPQSLSYLPACLPGGGCPRPVRSPGGHCLGNGIPSLRVLPVRRTTGQHLTAPNISSLHQDLLEELFQQRSLVTFLLPVFPAFYHGEAQNAITGATLVTFISHTQLRATII